MDHSVSPSVGSLDHSTARVLILGIGNVLWADEGFGVRVTEAMAERYEMPERITVLDGGTQGLYLLPYMEEHDALIVFDAIDYGLEPGTMKIVRNEDVPSFMGAKKMSLHQTGFQDVIATAQLMEYCPEHLLLIGVQPVELEDYGGGLRPAVAAQIDESIQIALDELRDVFGITLEPRQNADLPDTLMDASLRRSAYENGRPSEEIACRIGDDRFFAAREA